MNNREMKEKRGVCFAKLMDGEGKGDRLGRFVRFAVIKCMSKKK